MMRTIIKKELRGYFNSAIAVIFLATFLVVAMYTFFWREKFFARGIADLRPLFEWMPLLLIILVSALSMRIWSDERRAGTLEVLLTLPVPRWQLVAGKFLAGLALIGVALALTLGLPITIAKMGNLDLGPVVGGYLAAMLLSAAYLAIGMCVSAATNDQIVAFMGTAFLCGVAYAVGEGGGDIGRALGTGVRFESVARGVLDLRDLAYYGTIVAIGIAGNVVLLQRLTWSRGPRGHQRRMAALLGLGLVAANAIAFDLWLGHIRRARIDLTQDGLYSLSSATERILDGLDERLLIRGYFSGRTHPKLAPLVPQIRDMLDEYRIAGRGKVRIEIIDPTGSPDAIRDAKERFALDPTPLRFATDTEKSVVNAYFAIAIEYGDKRDTLGLDEMIKVRADENGGLDISLHNLEYQLTRSIKKTVSEFASVDQLLASMPGKVQMTVYMTPKTLPEGLKDAPARVKKLVDELTKQAGGKLSYTSVEPKGDAEMRDLYNRFGLKPHTVDLLGNEVYYFDILLQVGDRIVRVAPPQNLGEADLKNSVIEGLKRAAPGFTRVVGLWSPPAPPPMPPMEGMPPQRMPPPQQFETLRRALSGNYEVRDVPLSAPVPDDVEVLVLGGPASLDAAAVESIDQFVMRGGALVVLAGKYRLAMTGGGLGVEPVTTGLEAAFTKWGIKVQGEMVMDLKNDSFPIPQNRDVGNGMMVREIHQVPYPLFVKMDGDQLSSSSLITGGLTGSVMHWASPVSAEAKVGDDQHRVEALLRSSNRAWTTTSTEVEPNLEKFPELGFDKPVADKMASQVLAVAIAGGFASSLDAPKAGAAKDAKARIAHSPPDTRIVVFGSSAFASDDILGLAQQLDSPLAQANVELVHNAVDWALADTDLLEIRSRSAGARALTIEPDTRDGWRTANIMIAFIGLAFIVGVAWMRRRSVRPIAAEEVSS